MSEPSLQKDAMDVLQAWVDQYNLRAGGSIELASGGEAGGAQLRLKYVPSEGIISILHLVAVHQGGRPAIVVTSRASADQGQSRCRSQWLCACRNASGSPSTCQV